MNTPFLDTARRVIRCEADALTLLADSLDDRFRAAVDLMRTCKGRVIVTGIGKSGHIGNKIAATLASTGTPAQFVHPAEASHGDLGMITAADVVLPTPAKRPSLRTSSPIRAATRSRLLASPAAPKAALAAIATWCLNCPARQRPAAPAWCPPPRPR
jgi:D-arabinose 5-phosphate isomerase GutQ